MQHTEKELKEAREYATGMMGVPINDDSHHADKQLCGDLERAHLAGQTYDKSTQCKVRWQDDPVLSEHMQRMASTGRTGISEWTLFIEAMENWAYNQPSTQWIRVDSGELPERGERVLCLWHPLAQMKHDVTIDDLIDEKGFRRAAVIAWCRIPSLHTDLDNVTLVKG